jgi:hypothetical protein
MTHKDVGNNHKNLFETTSPLSSLLNLTLPHNVILRCSHAGSPITTSTVRHKQVCGFIISVPQNQTFCGSVAKTNQIQTISQGRGYGNYVVATLQ